MTKKLYRSEKNRVIAGVCGGVGEYFDVDPVLIRLAFLLITVFTALVPGLIFYVLAIAIVPDAPLITPSEPVESDSKEADDSTKI